MSGSGPADTLRRAARDCRISFAILAFTILIPRSSVWANALLATIGHAQKREQGRIEPPLVTAGDELAHLGDFLKGRASYTASDVVDWLLGTVPAR